MFNVAEDIKEEEQKLITVFKALKPWMNLDLYKAEEDAKKKAFGVSSTYVDELRKRGASEEEIAEVMKLYEEPKLNGGDAAPNIGDFSEDMDPSPIIVS